MEHVSRNNIHRSNLAYSVQSLLVIYVVLPLVVALGLGWLFALRQLEMLSEQRMQEEIELVARAIQRPLGLALERGSFDHLQESLASAAVIDRVYGASVYNQLGDLVLSVGARSDDWQPKVPEIVLDGDQRGEYGRTGGRRTYAYFVPLSTVGGTVNGVLQVTRQRRDFDEYFDGLRIQAMAALAAVAGLTVLMLLLGHHLAVGRYMKSLVAAMNRVEEGNPNHRAEEYGPREVRALAGSLNSMLDSIVRTQQELLEQRRIQVELARRLHSAEKLAAMGGLAAGVAHELGSPLSVVDGHAQRIMRIHDPGGAGATAARKIREQVQRMEAIVRQLLDFGGGRRSQQRLVKVEEVVAGVCRELEEFARMKSVSIQIPSGNCARALVLDVMGISQIVGNLLRNAIQSAHGGCVMVGVECVDKEVRIAVDDDGPGIPTGIEKRIFEPFFTTRPVGEGTGLGLALVHRIVDDMGGRITTEQSALGGARFLIILPFGQLEENSSDGDA